MARKIIEAIEAGKTSKKMFYSKIGRISSLELDSVLDQMVAQKMIRRYQAETGYWHYSN
jgi:DNA-binding HxlR family transcriptional regulator